MLRISSLCEIRFTCALGTRYECNFLYKFCTVFHKFLCYSGKVFATFPKTTPIFSPKTRVLDWKIPLFRCDSANSPLPKPPISTFHLNLRNLGNPTPAPKNCILIRLDYSLFFKHLAAHIISERNLNCNSLLQSFDNVGYVESQPVIND